MTKTPKTITKIWIENNLLSTSGYINPKIIAKLKLDKHALRLIWHGLKTTPICHCKNKIVNGRFHNKFSKYCSTYCMNHDPNRGKIIQQWNRDKYGVDNVFQLTVVKNKISKTMNEKYGVDNYFKLTDNMKQHYIESFGYDNPMNIPHKAKELYEKRVIDYGIDGLHGAVPKKQYDDTVNLKYGGHFFGSEIGNMSHENLKKNYGWSDDELKSLSNRTNSLLNKSESEIVAIKKKIYNTLVKNGVWIDLESKPLFEIYCYYVKKYTNQNDLEVLPNYKKRGRFDLNPDSYHLDHKYSKFQGFKNNIPPMIIGSIHNLEMIPQNENCSKNSRCSITVNQLIEKFYENRFEQI